MNVVQMAVTLSCLVSMLLIKSIGASVVTQGPVNLTRRPMEWAEFTCSVSCSHSIDWYLEGYQGDITEICSEANDEMTMTACKQVNQTCSSITSTEDYTETLRVSASQEFAGSSIAVQCAAISHTLSPDNCPPFLVYSRFALLSVLSPPPPTQAPTPPPPSPSPSPVVCPSTTQDVSTVTETVTEVVTVSQTVTVTVTPPAINRGHSHQRSHLGRVLSELLSWAVTMFVGVLIVL